MVEVPLIDNSSMLLFLRLLLKKGVSLKFRNGSSYDYSREDVPFSTDLARERKKMLMRKRLRGKMKRRARSLILLLLGSFFCYQCFVLFVWKDEKNSLYSNFSSEIYRNIRKETERILGFIKRRTQLIYHYIDSPVMASQRGEIGNKDVLETTLEKENEHDLDELNFHFKVAVTNEPEEYYFSKYNSYTQMRDTLSQIGLEELKKTFLVNGIYTSSDLNSLKKKIEKLKDFLESVKMNA